MEVAAETEACSIVTALLHADLEGLHSMTMLYVCQPDAVLHSYMIIQSLHESRIFQACIKELSMQTHNVSWYDGR